MPHDTHAAWQLAQLNVGKTLYPMGHPGIADFENALDAINALAEASPGFVWRLKDDTGNATGVRSPLGDDVLVNMSVWRDVESLRAYVYKSGHTAYLARRKEWFEMPTEPHMVLWWVPAGHRPTVVEAAARLMYLRDHGPTPQAFTFKRAFAPDGEALALSRP
ncbi:MAG: DUF3291 domain-containing protein [Alphaproteobacteria bacterium]|nr:MAG: DUF3291 domain-containing protein [Alphaproteobacteria bacterium]